MHFVLKMEAHGPQKRQSLATLLHGARSHNLNLHRRRNLIYIFFPLASTVLIYGPWPSLMDFSIHRHLVGLLGWGISPTQDLNRHTGQHNTETRRHTSMPRAGFEPAISMFKRSSIETGNLISCFTLCCLGYLHNLLLLLDGAFLYKYTCYRSPRCAAILQLLLCLLTYLLTYLLTP
jgi:hypothetical protein